MKPINLLIQPWISRRENVENWKHTISLEEALWVCDYNVVKIDQGFNCVTLIEDSYYSIDLDYLVFYKKEVILEPSNHSLVRLSNEVAESVYNFKKAQREALKTIANEAQRTGGYD
jgi:hypothetical protein